MKSDYEWRQAPPRKLTMIPSLLSSLCSAVKPGNPAHALKSPTETRVVILAFLPCLLLAAVSTIMKVDAIKTVEVEFVAFQLTIDGW